MPYKSMQIAKFMVDVCLKSGTPITNTKLQAAMYRVQRTFVNDPPPSYTLRGGGFVPLTRTQGIHMPAAPFDRGYVYAPG